MNYETILFEMKDHVATITLNRPEAANGLNLIMSKEMMDVVIHCDEDAEIRAVLLTGKGKFFSTGGDLKYFSNADEGTSTAL